MPDDHTPRRFFSEKEISTILRRATELQEADATTDPTGLTFEELQQIAAEAGIDPKYMVSAIAELEQKGDVDERFHWLGAPVSISLERVVEGEVSDEQWEEMVGAIREDFRLVGASGRVGQSREWTHDSKEQQAQVTVTSRDGQTKIRLFIRHTQLAAVTFVPALSAMLAIALASILSLGVTAPLFVWSFVAAALGVLFLALRFVFARLIRRKERRARQLLTRLEQVVAASTPAALPEAAARVDAALLSGEATPEADSEPARSRRKTSS